VISPPVGSATGFTLVELLMVIAIASILLVVGIPSLKQFVADQHVRTVASDLAADFAFARAQAVENSRRVHIQKTGVNWTNGWRIYVDRNDSNSYDVGEQVKIFDGLSGTIRVCTNVADFANDIIFRPDGRIVRTGVPTSNDGVYVIDDLGDTDLTNNKIRGILFGLSGRATVVNLNPSGQAVPLPC
jgi:prepilin-type N-terminal cleavage/methylation domain-containing protein